MSELTALRAENNRLRNLLAVRAAAEVTARTGLTEPEIDAGRECGARCEHGGFCSDAPGHDGLHNASGYCTWAS